MKLKKYIITEEAIIDNYSENVQQHIESLYHAIQKKPKRQVKKLKQLIEEFPEVPQFKNYLTLCYKNIGDKVNAKKIIQLTCKEHPDYFFGKITLAEHYLDIGEYEKIPDVLGSVNDILEIYPERDKFHISEVCNFHQILAKYYFKKDGYASEDYHKHFNRINEIYKAITGSSENKYTKYLSELTTAEVFKNLASNIGKFRDKTINVVADDYNKKIQTNQPPKFTHSEIEILYEVGFDIDPNLLKEILKLPRETLINDLETILKDCICRYEYFLKTNQKKELTFDNTIFIYHALFLLTEIESTKSIDLVIDLFRQGEEFNDFWFGYFLPEDFWKILYVLAENNLQKIVEFIKEPRKHFMLKTVVLSCLLQIALNNKEKEQEIKNIFKDLISFFLENKDNKEIFDNELIGFIVSDILDLRDEELFKETKILFDNNMVFEGIAGNYEDASKELEKTNSFHCKREPFTNIFDEYKEIIATWGYYNEEETDDEEQTYDKENFENIQKMLSIPNNEEKTENFIKNSEKTGRNEPCPCGSGKKYKKCCLRK